jgi:AraC-like DNA-binding protein
MKVPALDFAQLRLSTFTIPERDRVALVREELARRILRVEIEPEPRIPFCYEATMQAMPGLRIISASCTAACVRRTVSLASDGDNDVSLIVNLGRHAQLSQCGREIELAHGEATAVLHSEAASLFTTVPASACAQGLQLAIIVPHAALASRINDVEATAARLIPRRREALRLLVSYVRAAEWQAIAASPALRKTVVAHVQDLMALVVGPAPEPAESSLSAVAAARLNEAIEEIAARFHEPGFSVTALAQSQGVSPRYMQRLLEASGVCFTQRVNELRLERAFSQLTEANGGTGRISDIALSVGFSDISHFNRLFRARFGDSPRGVRGQLVSAATD